jgi:phosphorylcholine metabolism protein LicD
MHAGMPLVQCYHLLCGAPFLNIAAEDATGLEKVANVCFIPTQYLMAGSAAVCHVTKESVQSQSYYSIEQRFDYRDEYIWHKTALSYIALPASIALGSFFKGLSYFSEDARRRHAKILDAKKTDHVMDNASYYDSIGIKTTDLSSAEKISPTRHKRREGEENVMQIEKAAFKDIISILSKNKIMFWADCGTCLGTYRYGGIIPWDWDIDIAILQPDFFNVKNVLTSGLNADLYAVQDWSSRDKPATYLKVLVKATGSLIDIYNFAINEKDQTVHSILSNGDCVLMIESWKIRERRFTIPTSFDTIFPLKKADFDGLEVFVPAKTKEYLQQRYGENIEPAKICNEVTGQYEKDLTHPYWQKAYVH